MTSNTATIFAKKNMFAALAMASVLFLSTGCAPDVGAFGGGGAGSGSSESGGSVSTDPNGDNKSDKDADGKKDNAASAVRTGAACFPGNWIVNIEDMRKYMKSLSGGISITTTGHILLTYNEDGTTQTEYDHWNNTMKLEGVTSTVERHGIDKGKYTASDNGTFTISDTSIGSVTTMTGTGPGGPFSMSIDPEPSVFDDGQYTCSGDVLTIIKDGYNLTSFREH